MRASEVRLREVFADLVFNAVDAMPQDGCIRIHGDADEKYVVVHVTDTGIGMPEEVCKRCLEPLFSTKADQGTGLRLAMCHGIVNRHGGYVGVESEVGMGTTISVMLPRSKESDLVPTVAPKAPRPRMTGDSKWNVLVVDDDVGPCTIVERFLQRDNQAVTAVAGGADALARALSSRSGISPP